jgi:hypothetical protein
MKISNPCYVIQIKHIYEKDKKDVSHFNKKSPPPIKQYRQKQTSR